MCADRAFVRHSLRARSSRLVPLWCGRSVCVVNPRPVDSFCLPAVQLIAAVSRFDERSRTAAAGRKVKEYTFRRSIMGAWFSSMREMIVLGWSKLRELEESITDDLAGPMFLLGMSALFLLRSTVRIPASAIPVSLMVYFAIRSIQKKAERQHADANGRLAVVTAEKDGLKAENEAVKKENDAVKKQNARVKRRVLALKERLTKFQESVRVAEGGLQTALGEVQEPAPGDQV